MQQKLFVKTHEDLLCIKDKYCKGLEGKKYKILVCSGAGCISSNCHAVKEALEKCLQEH